jgi:hypothetical protein
LKSIVGSECGASLSVRHCLGGDYGRASFARRKQLSATPGLSAAPAIGESLDLGLADADFVWEDTRQPLGGDYVVTRLNALKHGVLSQVTVLPWEDGAKYWALLEALVDEHKPLGPTEEHLVEEVAGIIWRKRRSGWGESAVTSSCSREEHR